MTPLARLLNEAKGDRSVDALIAEAERGGTTVNHTARATIYRALRGEHAKNPRETTFELFSTVFSLDLRAVRDAAGKARGELGPWTPIAEANRLDQDQRTALDALIKTIVRTRGEEDDRGAETTPTPDPSPLPVIREVSEFEEDWAARGDDPNGRNR